MGPCRPSKGVLRFLIDFPGLNLQFIWISSSNSSPIHLSGHSKSCRVECEFVSNSFCIRSLRHFEITSNAARVPCEFIVRAPRSLACVLGFGVCVSQIMWSAMFV